MNSLVQTEVTVKPVFIEAPTIADLLAEIEATQARIDSIRESIDEWATPDNQ